MSTDTLTPPATPATAPQPQGLTWAPGLQTGDPRMDDTHHEFVDQLNTLLATPLRDQLPLYHSVRRIERPELVERHLGEEALQLGILGLELRRRPRDGRALAEAAGLAITGRRRAPEARKSRRRSSSR